MMWSLWLCPVSVKFAMCVMVCLALQVWNLCFSSCNRLRSTSDCLIKLIPAPVLSRYLPLLVVPDILALACYSIPAVILILGSPRRLELSLSSSFLLPYVLSSGMVPNLSELSIGKILLTGIVTFSYKSDLSTLCTFQVHTLR